MIGIDVGSKNIKLVELKKEGGVYNYVTSGIVAYNSNSIEKIEDEKELSQVAAIIRKLHKDSHATKKTVGISIPESLVFTRIIKYPLLTDQEIASAMEWEVEQYIPIPKSEAVVQHKIIERNEKKTPPEVKVLLIAAPLILVEKYVRLFQLAGLIVDFVETDLMSIARSVSPGNTTSVLVDFGAKSTDISICKDKNMLFVRSLPIAGEALTRSISQNLTVDLAQAEEYKNNYGLKSDMLEGKIEQVLTPVIMMIADEIKKAIHFYQTEDKGEAPTTLVLTGGSTGLKDVVPVFTKLLNMEVLIGNPLSDVKIRQEQLTSIQNYLPLLSIATGIAKREN